MKKLFLLGVLPEFPENYTNVKFMLDNLNTSALEFVTSADLKMGKYFFLFWYTLTDNFS